MLIIDPELGEEVFVDAAEDIAAYPLDLIRVQGTQQIAQDGVIDFLVFRLGQGAPQGRLVRFDGLHGRDDGLGAVFAVLEPDQIVELGLGAEEDGAALGEIGLGQCPGHAAPKGQAGDDLVPDRQTAAVGMAQEDQAHDRQELFVAGVVGVGAQGVCGAPEALFDGFEVFHGKIPPLNGKTSPASGCECQGSVVGRCESFLVGYPPPCGD